MRMHAFILAFFYFISSVGYGLEVHYCLGEVSDVNYFLFDTECPCDAVHNEQNGSNTFSAQCCEEQSFFNQLEDEHSSPLITLTSTDVATERSFEFGTLAYAAATEAKDRSIVERGPPIPIDRIIRYHKLTLYG